MRIARGRVQITTPTLLEAGYLAQSLITELTGQPVERLNVLG